MKKKEFYKILDKAVLYKLNLDNSGISAIRSDCRRFMIISFYILHARFGHELKRIRFYNVTHTIKRDKEVNKYIKWLRAYNPNK